MRILGIDIGSTSVKAVEIEKAFKRFEIHEYHEQKIIPGANPYLVVADVIQGLPKKPDRIAISLRSSQSTFRNLDLPTRDRKAIQSSIQFELEDDLPFPMDEILFDSVIVSQSSQGSRVHVAATLKNQVTQVLQEWQKIGIEPDLLTSESWAYRTLFNRILKTPEEHESIQLLIQMGHERTTLYAHWKGGPLAYRDINWGGKDLTRIIAERYQVSLDQAEIAKLDHGFVLTESQRESASADQVKFSDALLSSFQELLKEIRQMEFTCRSLTRLPLSTLYLSGGSSLLPGLGRWLEETLKVPVQSLHSLSAAAPSGVAYSEHTDANFVLAVSNALCLAGLDKLSPINFKKGRFTGQHRSSRFDLSIIKPIAISSTIVFTCLVISVIFQRFYYKKEIESLDIRLKDNIRNALGRQVGEGTLRTYMSNPKNLRARIQKEIDQSKEQVKLFKPHTKSPLLFLKKISQSIPKDLQIDMIQFQVGAAPQSAYEDGALGTASLTFLADQQNGFDRLSQILQLHLNQIEKSQIEQSTLPDGSKKYKLTLSGQPLEESYAP